jgi:hypothetical protein
LGSGLPSFRPGSSCRAVLRNVSRRPSSCLPGCHGLWRGVPNRFEHKRCGHTLTPGRVSCYVLQPHTRNGCRLEHAYGLGKAPVRSPLLRGLFLFLGLREMFQLARCPLPFSSASHAARRVAPLGNRRIDAWSPLPCAYRRLPASVIGITRQGIHHVLVLSCRCKPVW